MVGTTVNLDLLPLKRPFAIEESGAEHLPPEHTPEEKLRFLLQRVDFGGAEEKDAKKAKTTKEAAAQAASKWPWQGLVENLQMAQQELSYILDFITHVEANDTITVASMQKPKQLLNEACSELALRAASKLHSFKKIGKYLKQTAKALEQQVDREAVFYGALMRLQQHWKVKRLRGISAGPGGNAGFTIDLTYPQMPIEMLAGLSMKSAGLYSVNVEQDSSGLLIADVPSHSINTIGIHFVGPYIPHSHLSSRDKLGTVSPDSAVCEGTRTGMERKQFISNGKDVGEAVSKGAITAHSVLRRIQMALVEEQIFEWTIREGLLSSSGLVVTGVNENSVRLSLGNSCALVLELSKFNKSDILMEDSRTMKNELDSEEIKPEAAISEPAELGDKSKEKRRSYLADMSAMVCLHQAFYKSAFSYSRVPESPPYPTLKANQGRTTDGALMLTKLRDSLINASQDLVVVEPLKYFAFSMRHRVFSFRVLSELEKLVCRVPYLFLLFHPTWNARLTVWMIKLEIPQPLVQGWKMNMVGWVDAQKKSRSKFQLKLLIYDTTIFVEGIESLHIAEGSNPSAFQRSKHQCDLAELPGFLLYQLAAHLTRWLYEEALVMGLKVQRNLLSIFFDINGNEDFALIAALDVQAYCINWWLQLGLKSEEDREEDMASKGGKRFLGPINLETLRGVLVDLLSLRLDDA